MDLESFKKGVSYYTTNKGNKLVVLENSEGVEVAPIASDKASQNVADDFVNKILQYPEAIKKIKDVQKLHGLDSSIKRKHLLSVVQFLQDTLNVKTQDLKQTGTHTFPGLYTEVNDAVKAMKLMKDEAKRLSEELKLEDYEENYLFQYMTFGAIKGAVAIRIGKKFKDDDFYYLRVHRTTTKKDIGEAWKIAREYFKERFSLQKKSYGYAQNEKIFQEYKNGKSYKDIAKSRGLDEYYIKRVVRDFKKEYKENKR